MKHTKLRTDLSLITIDVNYHDVEYIHEETHEYQALFAVGVETVICFPYGSTEFSNTDKPCFMLLLQNDETLAETTTNVHSLIDSWITESIKDHALEEAGSVLDIMFNERTVFITSPPRDIYHQVFNAMVEDTYVTDDMVDALSFEDADLFIDPCIIRYKERAVALLTNA